MTLPWIPILLVGVVLAGCVAPPASSGAGKASRKAALEKAGAKAEPVNAAAATPVSQVAERLLKPSDGVVSLTGRVVVDASYLVGLGAGQIISNDGASVVAAGSGAIISNDGASIVGKDGVMLVSGGAGNIIANDGASIIANDGASLIGQDGAGLIGQDGAGFASDAGLRGFGLLSRRSLLAESRPPIGTTLPAAAMKVSVISMTTGQPVTLGLDSKGKPVTAIYTDAKGQYEVHVPSSYVGNVRLIAGVPKEREPRFNFGVIVPARTANTAAIDDDTELASEYTRLVFAGRLVEFFTPEVISRSPAQGETLGDVLTAEFIDAATTGPSKALSKDERWALALRVADAMLAHVDLGLPETDYLVPTEAQRKERCLDVLVEGIQNMRQEMATVMQGLERQGIDPETHFAANPHLQEAVRVDGIAYAIKRPADFSDFIVRSQMVRSDIDVPGRMARMAEIGQSFGLVPSPARSTRFSAAARGMVIYLMTTCFLNNENAREDGLALLRSGGK